MLVAEMTITPPTSSDTHAGRMPTTSLLDLSKQQAKQMITAHHVRFTIVRGNAGSPAENNNRCGLHGEASTNY